MENKKLKSGLIAGIVGFSISAVYAFCMLLASTVFIGFMTALVGADGENVIGIMMVYCIVILLLNVLGIIISAIALAKLKSGKYFGFSITALVILLVSAITYFVSGMGVFGIILGILLAISAILILLGITKK